MNPSMSTVTFPSGRIVTIDYFKGKSSVYFLSHFHMDHVVGLREVQHKCKIYCSSITKQLVQADQAFANAHQFLFELPINTAEPVPELPGLRVTLVPAGHCLGSVMFLFEDADSDGGFVALYTGDFRIPTSLEALRDVASFHRDGRVISIDSMVVDTTFFTEHCNQLPTREQSMQAINNLVGDCFDRHWNSYSTNTTSTRRQGKSGVVLVAKARFSYEYVYQSLADNFCTKVHISERSLSYYGQLASSLDFYSTNPIDCFVHLEGCGCDTGDMLRICLSTMYFDKTAGFTQPVVWQSQRTVRVLFSFHPSMSEVGNLLAYLRPRSARALVTPSDCADGLGDDDAACRVQARLDALLNRLQASGSSTCSAFSPSAFQLNGLAGAAAKRRHSPSPPPLPPRSPAGDAEGITEANDEDSSDSLCSMPVRRFKSKISRVS